MSLAIVHSRAQVGIEAPAVTVEAHLANGLPSLALVGLPETAVKESKDRVRSAILNCAFEFPPRRITLNLAPARPYWPAVFRACCRRSMSRKLWKSQRSIRWPAMHRWTPGRSGHFATRTIRRRDRHWSAVAVAHSQAKLPWPITVFYSWTSSPSSTARCWRFYASPWKAAKL